MGCHQDDLLVTYQLRQRNQRDNDVLDKKPTGDGDEGVVGGAPAGKEFVQGVAVKRNCDSSASNTDIAHGSRSTESVEGVSSRSMKG